LTNKQILVEGLIQFHQNSVWIYKPEPFLVKCDYIFSLITPSAARELHLHPGGIGLDYTWYMRHDKWSNSVDKSRLITFSPRTTHLIDDVVQSGGDQSTIKKIKLDIKMCDSSMKYWYRRHLDPDLEVKFKFSQVQRLAVHRLVQSFEVHLDVEESMTWSANCYKCVDNIIANLVAECEKVGVAFIPDGSTQTMGLHPNQPRGKYYKRLVVCRERTRASKVSS
jgi:hypothetical protein